VLAAADALVPELRSLADAEIQQLVAAYRDARQEL
jgi:hypothetical protein